jgi:hypothetical protein
MDTDEHGFVETLLKNATCHSERSEESAEGCEILRFAQDDILMVSTKPDYRCSSVFICGFQPPFSVQLLGRGPEAAKARTPVSICKPCDIRGNAATELAPAL